MKTDKLDYYLPAELIAQQPADVRSESKLLVLQRCSGELTDSVFSKIGDFLISGDCLVLNDTRVLPARFFGQRGSGGKLEALFLAERGGVWEVMLKGAGKVKQGETICLKDKMENNFCEAEILDKGSEGKCLLKIKADANAEAILEKIGFPPLPPYIKRGRDREQAAIDNLRYQTVYARHNGAIAAPTAGLHFTDELIEQLKQAGIRFAYITLHVGEGTFKPVTTDNLEEHKIHQEQFSIDEENAQLINAVKEKGGRIIAVGTTSVRVLETIGGGSKIKAAASATSLFIKPGYTFKAVDAMITNFHLPKSTLIALAAAFSGLENILTAYQHAVEQRYRFYSYGDAMLII
ncbi:MAG: tRNA preQ1(34) S-adenosylmethionine ribosyltransferase-isomerase QueA [Phycisphaerae bacterium]|nr:tRNA preQ1(34) S-adenosylmethionine ribosyltransferase-isomerase QueA [Phycisphaerae bacterium]MDD5380394.1 tRNA preQ1(34) S-adenosylmethionine ribosyltransferase-isomerase QueA [Phycisphaerae bacterium]